MRRMAYRPDQREVPVRAMTTAGLIEGALHLARNHMLLDHVNHTRELLTMTNVQVRDAAHRIPFFLLRRGQTVAMIPPPDDDIDDAAGKTFADHKIGCLTTVGNIAGTLRIMPSVRVSDYLQSQDGFFLLHNCQVARGALTVAERVPTVLVNATLVVGVTEVAPPSKT